MADTFFTVKLFHGRETAHETMHEWGFEGPVLGPLESVQVTYGALVLFTTDHERIELGRVEDLIFYDGKLYGDAVVGTADEQLPTEQVERAKTENAPRTWEHPAPIVLLKESELPTYRACVDVFVDTVLEKVSAQAGAAAAKSLNRIVRTYDR
jgi:hypothetical protein